MKDQVTTPDRQGVPVPGMTQPEGAPQGVAGPDAVDAGKLQERIEELEKAGTEAQAKYEQDMGRLRSTLDTTYAQKEQGYEARIDETEARMHSAAMANMEEAEKTVYQLDVARERNQRLQGQLEQSRTAEEASRGMMGYAKGFMPEGEIGSAPFMF